MAGQVNATLDYIEFPATDMAATKAFYEEVLGWTFTDYGPDYEYDFMAFESVQNHFLRATGIPPQSDFTWDYTEEMAASDDDD